MDPWLESPGLWPDVHDGLAAEIRAALNQLLPPPYYAQLGAREELEIATQAATRQIIPDVSVHRPMSPADSDTGGVAVADDRRTNVAESVELTVMYDKPLTNFVEIRDTRADHKVVTLIEILSPTNKRPGPDQDAYLSKREVILGSSTSLIEIDLLRSGRRDFFGSDVRDSLMQINPPLDYAVFVQRAWQRTPHVRYELFPCRLTEVLPVIAVPLQENEQESTLDLQYAFRQTYDRGPFGRGAVDYNSAIDPPLPAELGEWATTLLEPLRRSSEIKK